MGSHNVWDGAFAPYKRFAAGKTLAEGQFICPEHVQSPKGGVSLWTAELKNERTSERMSFRFCLSHMKKIFSAFSAAGVELSWTRKKLVATASRREGVYNRTGEPSVTFGEKEEQGSGRMTYFLSQTKNKSEQSELCSDVCCDINNGYHWPRFYIISYFGMVRPFLLRVTRII